MARLPDATAFGERPTPQAQRPILSIRNAGMAEAAEAEAGQALSRVGGQLFKIGQGLGEQQDRLDLAHAESTFYRGQIELARSLEDEPDYTKWESKFRDGMNKLGGQAAKNISDPFHKELFAEKSSMAVEKGVEKIRVLAKKKEIERGQTTLEELINGNLAASLSASDDTTRAGLLNATHAAIDSSVARGYITPEKAAEKKRVFATGYVEGSLSKWYLAQPDPYAAAQQVFDGKMPNPALQSVYDKLPPKARHDIAGRLIEDNNKLVTLRNRDRDLKEKTEKESAERQVKDFFFRDDLGDPERMNYIAWARTSPNVSSETVKKMEEFVRSGGRESVDNESDRLVVERAIRNDEIKTDIQLLNEIAKNNWQVSTKTVREKYIPLLEAKRKESFNEALKWAEAEVGGVSGGLVQLPGNDPVTVKLSRVNAQMRLFLQTTPDGDPWAAAKDAVDTAKKTVQAVAGQSLAVLAQQYREAIKSKNVTAMANAKTALGYAMEQAGMVTGLDRARLDFNPLEIIDRPKQ